MKKIKIKYNGGFKVALIDNEDFELVSQYNWYDAHGYAYGYKKGGKSKGNMVFMHRLILGLSKRDNIQVDHRDFNGLNNRRSNIRKCSPSQNKQNRKSLKNKTSKYLGVSLKTCKYPKKNGNGYYIYKRIIAVITVNKKHIHLGSFKNEIDAAKKYDEAALKYYKEFANLNFKENKDEKDIAA